MQGNPQGIFHILKHASSGKGGKFTTLYFGGSILEEPENRTTLDGLVEPLRRWLDRHGARLQSLFEWGRGRGDEDRVRPHFGDHWRGPGASVDGHRGKMRN